MNGPLHPKPASAIKAVVAAALFAFLAVSAAYGAPAIEGVWSFNGGAVDIQGQPGGVFHGVVTAPTKFAECSHPAGEEMWTEMRQQPDGSYFGLHQWLFEGTCARNPTLGPTAWRVLQSPSGARILRVCFSQPGGPQPTISPSGASANANWPGGTGGCSDSAAIATLPTIKSESSSPSSSVISFRRVVQLPGSAKCLKARRLSLKIAIREPRYDPLKEVVIRVNGHKLADVKGVKRLSKPIVLHRLPSGPFKLKVLATTVLNQHLSGGRSYRGCKRIRSGRVGVGKTHHRPSAGK